MSETIETGTRAAARGGFTAVCTMPNTQPVNDSASVTRGIVERAAAAASVRVWPIGAASVGSKGEALAEIAAMKDAGIVAVSDDGKPIATARLMRQVMDYCRALDLAGDRSLRGCVAFCGRSDARRAAVDQAGIERNPVAIGIDLRGARRGSGRPDRCAAAHRAHVDARLRSNTCGAAKKMGLRVTCEVTPHHFTLTDEDVQYDTHYKMNPPLASRADRDALVEGLADGSIDAIATDHAPHHPASKDVEFDRAPFGITGFETALALGLERTGAPRENFARSPCRAIHHRPGARSGHRAKNRAGTSRPT